MKKFLVGGLLVAVIGLAVALLPSPSPSSAATTGPLTVGHSPGSTWFDANDASNTCSSLSNNNKKGAPGPVTVTATQVPASTTRVRVTYGDESTKFVDLTGPSFSGSIPAEFACESLSGSLPNSVYLDWTATAFVGNTVLGSISLADSTNITISKFD